MSTSKLKVVMTALKKKNRNEYMVCVMLAGGQRFDSRLFRVATKGLCRKMMFERDINGEIKL